MTQHRKLTEKELNRMLDMAASGPLGYRPEIDDALMELSLVQWYDDDPSNQSVEWNTNAPLFDESGGILKEWYDPDAPIEIEIDFKCKFSIAQFGDLTREEALQDALREWVGARDKISDIDYITITEISEPVVS